MKGCLLTVVGGAVFVGLAGIIYATNVVLEIVGWFVR